MKGTLRRFICTAALVALFAAPAQAVILDNGLTGNRNFTVNLGQAGSSSAMSFGGWGDQVFAWDMYVNVGGTVTRLGDSSSWTSVAPAGGTSSFAYESVTNAGLRIDVMAQLPDASNTLETSYTIKNTGTTSINSIKTYQYLDPDLANSTSDFASIANLGGETMMVASDPTAPASSIGLVNGGTVGGLLFSGWEIDRWPVLENNILSGSYDLANAISFAGNPFDVTMALEYEIASLAGGRSATVSTELVANPVPEPGTMMLLGAGFLGLAIYGKRRKNA